MAKPRVFVSSTFYDLRYLRSSLEIFIESLGFDAILSEKGDVAYDPDLPLDESCYREVGNSDIYVLIMGGRYGSEVSGSKNSLKEGSYKRYESITKKEYSNALTKDIPTYVLIDKAVYSEYQTYQKNKDNEQTKYAHVDSVNIFRFIDEILSQPRNNPVHTFERHSDIQDWLRDQWSGLFKEHLQRRSEQRQLTSLSARVAELAEINETLKRYLEKLLQLGDRKQSQKLIVTESKRLKQATTLSRLRQNPLIAYLREHHGVPVLVSYDQLLRAGDLGAFLKAVLPTRKYDDLQELAKHPRVIADYAAAKKVVEPKKSSSARKARSPVLGKDRLPASE